MHVAAVRPEVGPHAVERVRDPPLHVVRVQPVHQQQAGDQVVGGERIGQLRVARSTAMPHHPFQAGTVEVGDLTDQLLRAFVRDGATRCAGVEQSLYPIARRAPLRVFFGCYPGDAAYVIPR